MKVMVLGSAGFLMSNFLRYVLYRDKEKKYGFASVDSVGAERYKRIYKSPRHAFHVGDATDRDLMKRLFEIEQPDVVVNGVGPFLPLSSTKRAALAAEAAFLEGRGAPLIQLRPDDSIPMEPYRKSYWDVAEGFALESQGACLRLPLCFGMRQREGYPFWALKKAISPPECPQPQAPYGKVLRYAYAEDVASMIWYLMETRKKGTVRMPALGSASEGQFLQMAKEVLGQEHEDADPHLLGPEDPEDAPGWIPDSKSLKESYTKTVKWYNINRWALQG